jgi:hypothetical protein
MVMAVALIISQEQIESLFADVQFIKDHLQSSKITPAADDLITESTLFEKLGNPDKSTVWRWEKKGRLKPIKIGNSKMYRISDLVSLQTKKK